MRTARNAALAAALAALWVTGASAETLAEVEKKVTSASSKIKSFTADFTYEMQQEQSGFKTSGHGQGRHEFMRDGDKPLWRSEVKMTTKMEMGGQTNEMKAEFLSVCDGEHTYTLIEQAGQTMASKSKLDRRQQGVMDEAMFASLREENTLELLPAEKVGDTEVYVVKATPKDSDTPTGPTMYYIGQEHGLMHKVVTTAPSGDPLMTITYKNIKPNVKLSADRFDFEAPEGVTVRDMTTAG